MSQPSMKLAVLSRSPGAYSTKRIVEAARKRGHKVKILDTLRFTVEVESRSPRLYYKDKLAPRYDAVIPRIGASITFFGTAIVRQFEQMGVPTLNTSHAITVSRDKLRSLQVLSRHNVGIPTSSYARHRASILPTIERMGGAPVVVKLLEGTQGVGVILAESRKTAQAVVETLQSKDQNVLVQRFVSESRGKDIRAFVVGGQVVAAMRRVAQGDEFRSNVHRGGRTEPVELPEEYEATAIRAAQILGLQVAGVDMLEAKDGPQIMEVNSSPGLEGIEKATGVDVADRMIAHLEEQVLFPEVDIKQRLTLKKGYGVAEFLVQESSELADQTLAQSDLSDREVTVLSITRGSVVLPAPRGETMIYAGDTLLCYGKLLTLKSLVPRRGVERRTKGR